MSEQQQQTTETKDKNVWTTALNSAVETISKDNKLISTILKIVLSPLGLIAILCGIGYLWYQNNEKKKKITVLEKELTKANYEIKDLEKEIKALEKARTPRQIVTVEEGEETMHGIEYLPARSIPKTYQHAKKKHIHLD